MNKENRGVERKINIDAKNLEKMVADEIEKRAEMEKKTRILKIQYGLN